MSYYIRLLKNKMGTSSSPPTSASSKETCPKSPRQAIGTDEILIERILEFLPQPSLKNCRLVNSTWKEVSREQFSKLSIIRIKTYEDLRKFYSTFGGFYNIYKPCRPRAHNLHLRIFHNFSFSPFMLDSHSVSFDAFHRKHSRHIHSLKIAIDTDEIYTLLGYIATMESLWEFHLVFRPRDPTNIKKTRHPKNDQNYQNFQNSQIEITHMRLEHLKIEFHDAPGKDVVEEVAKILFKAFPAIRTLSDFSDDPHWSFLSACGIHLEKISQVKVEYLGYFLPLIGEDVEEISENEPTTIRTLDDIKLNFSKLNLAVCANEDEGNPLSQAIVEQLDHFRESLEYLYLVFNVGNAEATRVLYVFPRLMSELRSLHLHVALGPHSPNLNNSSKPSRPFAPFIGMDNDFTYCTNRFPKLEQLRLQVSDSMTQNSEKKICENLRLLTGGPCPTLREFYCDVFKSLEPKPLPKSKSKSKIAIPSSQSIDKNMNIDFADFVGKIDKQFPNLTWVGTLNGPRMRWEDKKDIFNKLYIAG